MKPVFLHFTDHEGNKIKTFTTTSLKTGTMDNIFDIAERADNLDKQEAKLTEVKAFYNDLKSIILSIFAYQFSYDELNENVETEELLRVFKEVCSNIGADLRKN
jgi:hypothetical protein